MNIRQVIPIQPGVWLKYDVEGESEQLIGDAVIALALKTNEHGEDELIPIICDEELGFALADGAYRWRGLHVELQRPKGEMTA